MDQPGPEHSLFKQWVLEQDVTIKGIVPAEFPGRGIGMVAERNIEVCMRSCLLGLKSSRKKALLLYQRLTPRDGGFVLYRADEELVNVPVSALLSIDSIVPEVKNAAMEAGISVHGTIAMYLAITGQDDEDPYASWRRVWPSKEDLSTLPVMWPFSLRGLKKSPEHGTWAPLPPSINGEWSKEAIPDVRQAALATSSSRLEKQRRKIDKDWTRAKGMCEGRLEYNDYLYHWLLVNTRSFHFDLAEDQFESPEDKMALCPYMDYFNHAAKGCIVGFDAEGYTVTSDRAYKKGEELLISYGGHDNDLLLTDYGFILDDNECDTVPLDDLALHGPSGVYKHRNLLKDRNYFADYRVSRADGICYRTQMAAALQVLGTDEWQKVAGGDRNLTDTESTQVNDYVKTRWISAWLKEADRALAAWDSVVMRESKDVSDTIRQISISRWQQIQQLLRSVL